MMNPALKWRINELGPGSTISTLQLDYEFSQWNVFDRRDYPTLFFVEERYAADPTNIPNKAAVEAMLRSSGFALETNPERDVYLCRRGRRP